MFSSTMELDCSLEEFARALVAQGYLGDDSCFLDSVLPSVLGVFDSSDTLESPDSCFQGGPYICQDYQRPLLPSENQPSPLDPYLQDSLASSQITNPAQSCLRSPNSCLDKAGYSEPSTNSFIEAYRSNTNFLKDRPVDISSTGDTSSEQVNFLRCNDNKSILAHSFQMDKNNILTHAASDIENNNYLHQSLHFDSQSHIYTHSPVVVDLEVHDTKNVTHVNNHSSEQTQSQLQVCKSKQRRKRRNKGYSKPTKSRKRKNKTANSENKTQPKPKKQKLLKNVQTPILTTDGQTITFTGGIQTPQDDSGFESEEKQLHERSDSEAKDIVGSEVEINNNTNTYLDCKTDPETLEASKPLRRSSRTTRNPENYNFRLSSLVKRVETEKRQREPRPPKDRLKPAPLSKYRRRTANARERDRMKEINDAFDKLRGSLPSIRRDDGKEKVTKFTILKHALNYIASLRDILGLEGGFFVTTDDDVSSELSSVRSVSVASLASEESCSSPPDDPALSTFHFSSGQPGLSSVNSEQDCQQPCFPTRISSSQIPTAFHLDTKLGLPTYSVTG